MSCVHVSEGRLFTTALASSGAQWSLCGRALTMISLCVRWLSPAVNLDHGGVFLSSVVLRFLRRSAGHFGTPAQAVESDMLGGLPV